MKFLKINSLFKDELVHLSLSLISGVLLSIYFKNLILIPASILTGFLIDSDHLFDYFYWAGKKFNLKDFLSPAKYVHSTKKVFVLFHGWEYLILLFVLGKTLSTSFGIKGFEWALTASYFLHLVWDQITCTKNPFGYFLIYRIFVKFKLEKFNER
jgi:hypothetical protein